MDRKMAYVVEVDIECYKRKSYFASELKDVSTKQIEAMLMYYYQTWIDGDNYAPQKPCEEYILEQMRYILPDIEFVASIPYTDVNGEEKPDDIVEMQALTEIKLWRKKVS